MTRAPFPDQRTGTVTHRTVPAVWGDPDQEPEDLRRRAYEMFHDIRQPVATIGALVAAAANAGDPATPLRSLLDQIGFEVRRMAAMVDGALAQQSRRGPVDVADLLLATSQSWQRTQSCRVVAGPVGPEWVGGESTLIRRALDNLVENAVRAAGPHGQVILSGARDGEWVSLAVDDDGPGFGNGPAGSSSLGLRIADRVARVCGGRLRITESDRGGVRAELLLLPVGVPLAIVAGEVLPA